MYVRLLSIVNINEALLQVINILAQINLKYKEEHYAVNCKCNLMMPNEILGKMP